MQLTSNLGNSTCRASSFEELKIAELLSVVEVKCIFDKR